MVAISNLLMSFSNRAYGWQEIFAIGKICLLNRLCWDRRLVASSILIQAWLIWSFPLFCLATYELTACGESKETYGSYRVGQTLCELQTEGNFCASIFELTQESTFEDLKKARSLWWHSMRPSTTRGIQLENIHSDRYPVSFQSPSALRNKSWLLMSRHKRSAIIAG